MNTVVTQNYQTSFGMKQNLKKYAIIQQKAKNTYQHISPFIFQSKEGAKDIPKIKILAKELSEFRVKLSTSDNPLKVLIEYLKNGNKLANGGEEATLATTIGRMNGQKNIYTGQIKGLDHAVSFVTDKVVRDGNELLLKGKKAIIIDPQLGITDYVGNYFLKLQERMNNSIKQSEMSIIPIGNKRINAAQMADLRASYPELLIENYKNV